MTNQPRRTLPGPSDPTKRARSIGGLVFATVLSLVFIKPLFALAIHASQSEMYSYVLLVPFISLVLIWLGRKELPVAPASSPGFAAVSAAVGLSALAAGWHWRAALSENDFPVMMALAFLCLLVAGGFFFMGREWMSAAAFPIGFLFFMIPPPDCVLSWLMTASQLASAEVAEWLFAISSTPVLRDGVVMQLPGMTIEVEQECSGIRSSLVLFITAVLASHLLLRSPWRRVALVAAVIPLALLRNGFRIMVIGLLCVHIGPHMINSPIHRRGGPVFFVLSLIPLFLLVWWLRRGESKTK